MHIDATNLQILDLLQKDARMSIADLARLVNRAESTVRERVTALESAGVINGYHAHVDADRVGRHAHAILYASCDLSRLPEVVRRLEAIPQVVRVLHTTGKHPLIIEVVAEDLAALERLLETRIAGLGLDHVEVSIIVRQHLAWRPLRLSPTVVPLIGRRHREVIAEGDLTLVPTNGR